MELFFYNGALDLGHLGLGLGSTDKLVNLKKTNKQTNNLITFQNTSYQYIHVPNTLYRYIHESTHRATYIKVQHWQEY